MDGESGKIYELTERQKGSFRQFEKLGEDNKMLIIARALAFLRDRLDGHPAVVGVSGGIDSAVVLALAARAVGASQVIAVEMPMEGISSPESAEMADVLAETFEVATVYRVPIGNIVKAEAEALRAAGAALGDFELGNVMARVRMTTLYAIANRCGGRVLDTCNLTEIRMGYFTKFGDGASDLNPVGSIYKTWIRILARELGVPQAIIARRPTAELTGEGQSDEMDMGISYAALDLLLYLKERGAGDTALSGEYYFSQEVVDMVNARIAVNRHKNVPAPVCQLNL